MSSTWRGPGSRDSARRRSRSPGCPVFPADNPWNQRVDTLPVHSALGRDRAQHRARGDGPSRLRLRPVRGRADRHPRTDGPARAAPRCPVPFEYADESDRGPYPIPPDPPIEGGGDRHMLIVQRGTCRLYELFAAERSGGELGGRLGRDLQPALEPPAPARLDERRRGRPADPPGPGALRRGRARRDPPRAAVHGQPRRGDAFVFPARHFASSLTDPDLPAMGQRLRLKAGVSPRAVPAPGAVIVQRAQALRDAAGRQRLGLVHLRRAAPALGQRRPARPQAAARQRLRGRQ